MNFNFKWKLKEKRKMCASLCRRACFFLWCAHLLFKESLWYYNLHFKNFIWEDLKSGWTGALSGAWDFECVVGNKKCSVVMHICGIVIGVFMFRAGLLGTLKRTLLTSRRRKSAQFHWLYWPRSSLICVRSCNFCQERSVDRIQVSYFLDEKNEGVGS